jgi:hypothetical protein
MQMDQSGWQTVRSALVVGGALIAAAALTCAAQAAGPFDGTYIGTAVLLSGNNGAICKTFSTSIAVTDGHLTYVHGAGYAVIHTDVGADGSFSGSALLHGYKTPVMETLTGKASDSGIEADAGGPYCKYRLTLRKQQ